MSLFENSDATSATDSLSSLESIEELNLVDIKNWLEFHYGSYRRPTKLRRRDKKPESQRKIEIEFDISSAPDYIEDNEHSTSIEETWNFSYRKLEEINYGVIGKEDIVPDEEKSRASIHRCCEEDKLLVALGIRYALTDELPIGWSPSLLIDILLEAATYTAITPLIQKPDFLCDLITIQRIANPWTDSFSQLPEYVKRGIFDFHWVCQISRTGPYVGPDNDLAIPYRHRPWNNYFRKKRSTVEDILNQPQKNYEGNPHFIPGRLQRGIIRTIDESGRNIITVVRGGKVRRTVLESEYIEESTKAHYESGTAENPTEV